ncbi:EPC1 isoform 5 [Pan troglodytes]|uniref:Enhancer of polycomb homolog 1 n=4 Tax=Homininae TaxID=207598 RepID=EPC1_HUMAN|nr:enhancer of polycomb homolog 1 isoform a [Homo sapiens]XP_003814844.1 enhancer of polycomb homolog 1 isoform X1 [Pan paniscus]XP_016818429.1 enhancer of polycomb homolog 1 isoform X1 [Pan troglodytes]Q9H2F5.1 RecName: Full=Enhancer of polycomb homolog 1 [Homo sapiens]AAG41402.1 enhancer of polycomb [Homo sapiens]EAW85975.1 enhancer of polycomb homolog 1 (Drosophila), isoform CRA_c [Homo sapiens]KAI4075634.1 enhancer of polycomb homolog 1 [Homo sapiens]PNI60953.1 EPC1 isoform 5 [Pan troglo|eukprot:NP_079485.1 enhancer of polycomb homolog 1 isoform a [Homo sapiens]
MSKLSFRARALDASKPLPVFRCEDLPDLHEYASINRAVPQMPTGMEKEEESEHHLQRAISAQQVYGEKRDNMVIPVPEAESNIAYYESIYPGEFKMPKQLIHIQPFSLDAEQPDYDLDSEDEVFVNKLKKKMDICPLQFEEMIDRLEKGSGQQPVSLQEAKLLLKEDDELIREVYEYWIKKRKNCRGPSLIPSVKQEKRDGSSTNDPYVAFRRRTEKMQTRKNRKNDEASYEKMLKLRRDLSRAVTILEMIKRREKSKRELLHLTLEIMEKRYNLGDYNGEIMSEVMAQRQPMKPTYAIPIIPITNSSQFKHQEAMDVKEFKVNKQDKADLIRPKRKYEKKPKVLPSSAAATPQQTSPAALPVFNAKDLNQYDFPSSDEEPLSQVLSGSSEAEEDNDPDGPFAFRRKAGCQYYAPHLDQTGNWPWTSPKDGGLGDVRYRYCLTTLTVPQRCIGFARRRVGRGGRVLLDRAHSDYDSVFHHLDLEMLSSPQHSPVNQFANTSETNTSDKSFSKDLSQILVNIKSCRWRHFRPRTPSLHDSDNDELSCRKLYRSINRTGTAQPGTQTCSTSTQSKSSSGSAHFAFTAEQYQQHQQQLALMQKQQLAQIQQQQANSNSSTNTSQNLASNQQKSGFRLNIQGLERTLQGFVSKTLDSASAQFAASALVTSEQLMGFKMKDDVVLGIGVNGVLPASGVYKGLHLSSTTPTALVHTSPSTAGSALLQPSNITQTSSSHSALSHQVTAANSATTQVLIGNNIRLTVPSSVATVNSIAPINARHIPRTLSAVPSSALKLAAAANCQVSKVPSSSSVDSVPRENHESEKPALNNIADNTVAMEVT